MVQCLGMHWRCRFCMLKCLHLPLLLQVCFVCVHAVQGSDADAMSPATRREYNVSRNSAPRPHVLTVGTAVVQMKVLGGAIGATSNPDHGSIFWFCFPIEEPPGSTSNLPLSSSWHPPSSGNPHAMAPPADNSRRSLPSPAAAPMTFTSGPVSASGHPQRDPRGAPRSVPHPRVAFSSTAMGAAALQSERSSSQAMSSLVAPTTITTTNSPATGSSFWRSSHSTRRSGVSNTSFSSYNTGTGHLNRPAASGPLDDDPADGNSMDLFGAPMSVGAASPHPPGSPPLPGWDPRATTPTAMGPSAGVTEVARYLNSPPDGAPLFLSLASDSLLYRRSASNVPPAGRRSARTSGAVDAPAVVDATPAEAAATAAASPPPSAMASPPGYPPAVPAVCTAPAMPLPTEPAPIPGMQHMVAPALPGWSHPQFAAPPPFMHIPPPMPQAPWPDYQLAMWSQLAQMYGLQLPPGAVPTHYAGVPPGVVPGMVWPGSALYASGGAPAPMPGSPYPGSPASVHAHAPPHPSALPPPWSVPLLSSPHSLDRSHVPWPYPGPLAMAQPSPRDAVGVPMQSPLAYGGVAGGPAAPPALADASTAAAFTSPAAYPDKPPSVDVGHAPAHLVADASANSPPAAAAPMASGVAGAVAAGAPGVPPQGAPAIAAPSRSGHVSECGHVPESHAGSSSVCDSLSAWGQPRSQGGSFDEVRAHHRRSLELANTLPLGAAARFTAMAQPQHAHATDGHPAQHSVAMPPSEEEEGRGEAPPERDAASTFSSGLGAGPPTAAALHENNGHMRPKWQHALALVPESSNEGSNSIAGDRSARQSHDLRSSCAGSSGSEWVLARAAGDGSAPHPAAEDTISSRRSQHEARGASALKRSSRRGSDGSLCVDDGASAAAGRGGGAAAAPSPAEAHTPAMSHAPGSEGMAVASVSTVHSTHGYWGGSEDGLRSRTASQRSFGDEPGGSTPHDYGIEARPPPLLVLLLGCVYALRVCAPRAHGRRITHGRYAPSACKWHQGLGSGKPMVHLMW